VPARLRRRDVDRLSRGRALNRTPIEPASIELRGDGTPFDVHYGDVYHAARSGPGQARHVFLGGNELPRRWAARERFVVLETGFGLGLNFLVTLDAWRRDPARPNKLHYVAIDRHPPTPADLEACLRPYAAQGLEVDTLLAAWPPSLPGTHRRTLAGGDVVLTLVLDDIESALARLVARPDAIYLDGFAPDRNPAMWSASAMRHLARLAPPGTTLATWCTARAVRDALEAAGFGLRKAPGFAPKREMLVGIRLAGRAPAVMPAIVRPRERRALIVGAGIAGAAAASALSARNWTITLVDAAVDPPGGASAILAGTFHPLVARDDSRLARLARAGTLAALATWPGTTPAGAFATCGVLQLAVREGEEARHAVAIDALAFPPSYARVVEAREASALAGVPLSRGGIWFAGAGWARAPMLAAGQLDALGRRVTRIRSRAAARLERGADGWMLFDATGAAIASAPVVILANGADASRLAPTLALRALRGQATYLDAGAIAPPRAVVIGHGYALPPIEGVAVVGSSYDRDDARDVPSEDSHDGNLARWRRLFDRPADERPAVFGGGVGFRAVTPDRLPLVGAVPGSGGGLYAIGGFGSRGLTWSAIAGEALAAMIEDEPLPLESDLVAAIDPARFALRAARRAGR